MPTAEAERTWKFVADQTSVTVEALHSDVPDIAANIRDPTTKLGKAARMGNIFVLKTRGFALSALRSEYELGGGSLDEFFPVQCKFDIDHKLYLVVHTDRPAVFPKGRLIP